MCGGCKFSCLKKVPRRAHHQAGTRAKNTHLVARLGTFLNGDRRTLDRSLDYYFFINNFSRILPGPHCFHCSVTVYSLLLSSPLPKRQVIPLVTALSAKWAPLHCPSAFPSYLQASGGGEVVYHFALQTWQLA